MDYSFIESYYREYDKWSKGFLTANEAYGDHMLPTIPLEKGIYKVAGSGSYYNYYDGEIWDMGRIDKMIGTWNLIEKLELL